MKALVDILHGLSFSYHSQPPLVDARVSGISSDSRSLQDGELFVALRGTQVAALQFSNEALNRGALGIVFHHNELPILSSLQQQYPNRYFISVEHTSIALGTMAANFYGNPSKHLCLIGVTGTNGKTTIATLLQRLLRQLGERCGLLSTLAHSTMGAETIPAMHTTPDALSLQRLMADMLRQCCRYACIEVSSHAIAQHRIAGLHFDGGILSNITHDHLDYHNDFLAYARVKKQFFDELPRDAFVLTNVDDKHGQYILQNCRAHKQKTYALKRMADYKGRVLSSDIHGLEVVINDIQASFRLSGTFNAYNLLAVAGAAHLLGIELESGVRVLSGLEGVRGRFERVPNDREVHVIIDFAHTPDALEEVLSSLTQMARQHKQSRLFSVFGCAGNKDVLKRSKMGKIACRYSDVSFFTSDNPRDEEPQQIIDDMQKTLRKKELKRVHTYVDRAQAIREALSQAVAGDYVLIAGKGHEDYQEIAGVRHRFSDRRMVEECLQMLEK